MDPAIPNSVVALHIAVALARSARPMPHAVARTDTRARVLSSARVAVPRVIAGVQGPIVVQGGKLASPVLRMLFL